MYYILLLGKSCPPAQDSSEPTSSFWPSHTSQWQFYRSCDSGKHPAIILDSFLSHPIFSPSANPGGSPWGVCRIHHPPALWLVQAWSLLRVDYLAWSHTLWSLFLLLWVLFEDRDQYLCIITLLSHVCTNLQSTSNFILTYGPPPFHRWGKWLRDITCYSQMHRSPRWQGGPLGSKSIALYPGAGTH